jgi:hypothetical protein
LSEFAQTFWILDHFVLGTNWEIDDSAYGESHSMLSQRCSIRELHCTTLQCHSVYGESALSLNFPHTEPTQNGFSTAEPTQYEIPLTQS